MSENFFGETVSFTNKVLDLRSKRHELLLSNIANQNTPQFKSKDVDFKEALQSAIGEGGVKNMNKTDSRHFSNNSQTDFESVVYESEAGSGIDGNNVSPEMEMAKMSENALLFNANITLLRKTFQGLRIAIRGR